MSNEVKTKEKIDMDPKYIVKLTVTLLGTCLIHCCWVWSTV